MKRVAEIIHIVESEREEFLRGAINLSEEEKKVLWVCGVRKQQYFALNDLIFMTFEYKGNNFNEDMAKMAAYLDTKGHLVHKRRRDVPVEERATTNWWAPVKKLGTVLDVKPESLDDNTDAWQENYRTMLSGGTFYSEQKNDISFDEDDWSESIHF